MLVAPSLDSVLFDRPTQSLLMKPFVCAACGEVLTSALWDKATEQMYCRQCIPPLPPQHQRGQPTTVSKMNVSDMKVKTNSE